MRNNNVIGYAKSESKGSKNLRMGLKLVGRFLLPFFGFSAFLLVFVGLSANIGSGCLVSSINLAKHDTFSSISTRHFLYVVGEFRAFVSTPEVLSNNHRNNILKF